MLSSKFPSAAAGLPQRPSVHLGAVSGAHSRQYDLIDGLARNMRDALSNASFIGFTGRPIAQNDTNTRAVFGEYFSVYDILQAVIDKATVPIY